MAASKSAVCLEVVVLTTHLAFGSVIKGGIIIDIILFSFYFVGNVMFVVGFL